MKIGDQVKFTDEYLQSLNSEEQKMEFSGIYTISSIYRIDLVDQRVMKKYGKRANRNTILTLVNNDRTHTSISPEWVEVIKQEE